MLKQKIIVLAVSLIDYGEVSCKALEEAEEIVMVTSAYAWSGCCWEDQYPFSKIILTHLLQYTCV